MFAVDFAEATVAWLVPPPVDSPERSSFIMQRFGARYSNRSRFTALIVELVGADGHLYTAVH
jgi:hypothetical protein